MLNSAVWQFAFHVKTRYRIGQGATVGGLSGAVGRREIFLRSSRRLQQMLPSRNNQDR